jgi:hypothetical protein
MFAKLLIALSALAFLSATLPAEANRNPFAACQYDHKTKRVVCIKASR